MIVCADSTGHGVPGAFMSMIGTTLIKDICLKNESFSPADILRMLDSDLRGTLNQNIEAERSNDGMDIIVCEIDINTYQVRISSAMRPLILYRSGEQILFPEASVLLVVYMKIRRLKYLKKTRMFFPRVI